MESIERIKRCKNDEQLYWLTKKLIKEAINDSKGSNTFKGLIGTKTDVNEKAIDLDIDKKDKYKWSVDVWNGFIPMGTKVVYATIYDKLHNTISNGGYYYYVDDEEYIYEFIKSIKGFTIDDEFDAISAVNDFCENLFSNNMCPKDRMEMHKLLFKNEYQFFEPQREHSIKDFYKTGSARCTEYAVIANNLLSVLKIPISYFMDKDHAYNVLFVEKEEDIYDSYILDYSFCVTMFNEKLESIGRFPFFKKIENGDKAFIEEVVNKGKRIHVDDYNLLCINNRMFECATGKVRDYGVEHEPLEEKSLILKKERKF